MAIFNWITQPRRGYGQWRDLERMRNHMENIYNSLAEGVNNIRLNAMGLFPLVNISEDGEHFYATAELPGIPADQVELSVKGESLAIKGERVIQPAGDNVSYHRREREAGRFSRVVALPAKVEADGVEASFKNGILKVVLPKAAEAKVKPITIKAE